MSNIPILIVEDDPMLGNCLKDWFEDDGFSVTLVPTAVEALQLLQSGKYRICFSDLNLAGMNGDDFIRLALPLHPQTCFMILTGLRSYCLDDSLRSLGMRDEYVLYKPLYPMKILSDSVRKALSEA